jgi:hypothetical protein
LLIYLFILCALAYRAIPLLSCPSGFFWLPQICTNHHSFISEPADV